MKREVNQIIFLLAVFLMLMAVAAGGAIGGSPRGPVPASAPSSQDESRLVIEPVSDPAR